MLALEQHYRPPLGGFSFEQLELRAPDVVIVRSTFRGCRLWAEPGMTGRRRDAAWSKIVAVLEGEVRLDGPEGHRVARAGESFATDSWADWPAQAITHETAALVLLYRNDGPLGAAARPTTVAPLSASTLARLRALPTTAAAPSLGLATTVVESLRAEGHPLDVDGLRAASAALGPREQAFARATYEICHALARQPMLADVGRAIGLGARQTLRLAQSFLSRCYPSLDSFRTLMRALRLSRASLLLSADRATEVVAYEAGFASVPALYHAFENAGWPSPGAVRRALVERG